MFHTIGVTIAGLTFAWLLRRIVTPAQARQIVRDSVVMLVEIAKGVCDGVLSVYSSGGCVWSKVLAFFIGSQVDSEAPQEFRETPALVTEPTINYFVQKDRHGYKIRCAGTGYSGPCQNTRNYVAGVELYLCSRHEAQRSWLED